MSAMMEYDAVEESAVTGQTSLDHRLPAAIY